MGSLSIYQAADLIAPDDTIYVQSNLRDNHFTTLLVPNFFTQEILPKGVWRYRIFSMNHFEHF